MFKFKTVQIAIQTSGVDIVFFKSSILISLNISRIKQLNFLILIFLYNGHNQCLLISSIYLLNGICFSRSSHTKNAGLKKGDSLCKHHTISENKMSQ